MPGIGLVIDGAMQQAPQDRRQASEVEDDMVRAGKAKGG